MTAKSIRSLSPKDVEYLSSVLSNEDFRKFAHQFRVNPKRNAQRRG
jgi:hypothetical protein